LRERFIKKIKNKTLHISFLKRKKQPKTKTTKKIVMISKSNDDEERETLLKR
jgi:hypothetical protein